MLDIIICYYTVCKKLICDCHKSVTHVTVRVIVLHDTKKDIEDSRNKIDVI